MSCCGQKRDAIADGARPTNLVSSDRRGPAPSSAGSALPRAPGRFDAPALPDRNLGVTLRSRQRAALAVRGSATGKRYLFAGHGSTQAVDHRDAEALVATGWFERIWG